MMRWLRRFFYSDDPAVELVGALGEPEAEMWRELLANEGIPAFTKIVDSLALSQGRATGMDCALLVKRSDLERAREVLAPLIEEREAEARSRGRREYRRRP